MKILRYIAIFLSLFSQLGLAIALAAGEYVELEQNLHGRGTKTFYKKDKNIRMIVPSGTKAQILEVSKLKPSGNHALKIEVLNPRTKEKELVWVYYRNSNPGMKIYKDDQDALDKKEASIEQIKDKQPQGKVETTRDVASIKDPLSFDIHKTVKEITDGNNAVDKSGNSACDNCELYLAPVGTKKVAPPVKEKPEIAPQKPTGGKHDLIPKKSKFRDSILDEDSSSIQEDDTLRDFKVCPSTAPGQSTPWVVCRGRTTAKPISIQFDSFRHRLPRNAYAKRTWEMYSPSNAKQNMRLTIRDISSSSEKEGQISDLVFLPRKALPKMEKSGNQVILTIPTGEKVHFDSKTMMINGGVLSEGSLPRPTKSSNPPPVSYSGTGVLIRSNAVARDPRQSGSVTISKAGHNPCTLPSSEVYGTSQKTGETAFKFGSDAEASAFIQSKCGFGIE